MGGNQYGGQRIARKHVIHMADMFHSACMPVVVKYTIAGSYRRGKEDSGDIEMIYIIESETQRLDTEAAMGKTFGYCTSTVGVRHSGLWGSVQFDCFLAYPHALGAMLLHCTGSGLFNIKMRARAKARGWTLNQYGIFYTITGIPVMISPNEEDFFKVLEMDYIKPEDRNI